MNMNPLRIVSVKSLKPCQKLALLAVKLPFAVLLPTCRYYSTAKIDFAKTGEHGQEWLGVHWFFQTLGEPVTV